MRLENSAINLIFTIVFVIYSFNDWKIMYALIEIIVLHVVLH